MRRGHAIALLIVALYSNAIASGPQDGSLTGYYGYERLVKFDSMIGTRNCHKLTFPCKPESLARFHGLVFGRTNEIEIKFSSGLCKPGHLLCFESEYNERLGMLSMYLAENESGECWSDSVTDWMIPRSTPGEIFVPLADGCEPDLCDDWCTCHFGYEDDRKIDFLDWIAKNSW